MDLFYEVYIWQMQMLLGYVTSLIIINFFVKNSLGKQELIALDHPCVLESKFLKKMHYAVSTKKYYCSITAVCNKVNTQLYRHKCLSPTLFLTLTLSHILLP